jgi:hypothetical protein
MGANAMLNLIEGPAGEAVAGQAVTESVCMKQVHC